MALVNGMVLSKQLLPSTTFLTGGSSKEASCFPFQIRVAPSVGRVNRLSTFGRRQQRRLISPLASSSQPGTKSSDVEGGEKAEVYVDPKRALKEVYATIETGKSECKSCGYLYDAKTGDPSYPIAPGTKFSELPTDWACPTCGSPQSSFKSAGYVVAGFAENQKYGFGTNSMTEGQKSILIYGSLLLGFLFFMSGYLLS